MNLIMTLPYYFIIVKLPLFRIAFKNEFFLFIGKTIIGILLSLANAIADPSIILRFLDKTSDYFILSYLMALLFFFGSSV